ncbi:MAG: hypothetical protein GKR86_00985 [Ilumatobacter sp.]|nr:hypothetical protein [Ilumatobacter sp.]
MQIDNLIADGYDLLNSNVEWPTYDGGDLDRSRYVTSSEVWNCALRIYLDKKHPMRGFPDWGYAERGNIIEEWAMQCAEAAVKEYTGYDLLHTRDKQVSFHHGRQSGTPDGILRLPDYSAELWEVKSLDPRYNWSNLPKEPHIWQLTQNMDLVSHCMDITVQKGRLIYIDASNLQKRKEYVIAPHEGLMQRMEAKAHFIMDPANSEEDMPTDGIFRGECRLCRHKARCNAAIHADKVETDMLERATNVANSYFKR